LTKDIQGTVLYWSGMTNAKHNREKFRNINIQAKNCSLKLRSFKVTNAETTKELFYSSSVL